MKRWIAVFLMVSILFSAVAAQAEAKELSEEQILVQTEEQMTVTDTLCEKAVSWLLESRNANGSYGDDRLPRDTCQVEKLFSDLETESYPETGEWLKTKAQEWTMEEGRMDNDSASRLYCATGDETYLEEIEGPNPDGGYGLTGDYQSDPLDTALVLEALVRQNLKDGRYEQEIAGILTYLQTIQKENGGFSYLSEAETDEALTLRIALSLSTLEKYREVTIPQSLWEMLDGFCERSQNFAGADDTEGNLPETESLKESAGNFEKEAYRNVYLCMTEQIENTDSLLEELTARQQENGSYFDSPDATIAAIRLMEAIREYNTPYLELKDMETELSAYTLYTGYERKLTVESAISYRSNDIFEGTWCVEILEKQEAAESLEATGSQENTGNPEATYVVIETKKQPVTFTDNKSEACMGATCPEEACPEKLYATQEVSILAEEGCEYLIRTSLVIGDEVQFANECRMYQKELVIEDLELQAEYTTGEGAKLGWNDISNDFCRYGYRVYRSTDMENWETRSSWDGEEKVKVLNVYPIASVENVLTEWMEKTISGEGVPAGKGLFEIDKVCIDDYNREPEKYLLNEDGTYKYDVLFFGAADSNGHKDLTELSYRETQKFVDAGRGVLFGHDTITMGNNCEHPYFSKFEEQLGIKLKESSGYITGKRVEVINSGFLTSYPWKIEGVLDIPTTHAYQQYSGGTLKGTVWMRMVNGGYTDTETGGCTDAYLTTYNQLALIQTGHSNGQATDDERKVLANTLFYLKQLTRDTAVTDRSAYDMASPGAVTVSELTRNEEGMKLTPDAEDYGTTYYYYTEAIPQGMEGNGQSAEDSETSTVELHRTSQVEEICVISGIKGYEICINDSAEACGAEDFGTLFVTGEGEDNSNQICITENLLPDRGYIHIRAVDHQGNIGEELILELPKKPEKEDAENIFGTGLSLFGNQDITIYCSTLSTDGEVYSGGNFTFGGSALNIRNRCSTTGQMYTYAGAVEIQDRQEYAEVQKMPQLGGTILKQLGEAEKMENLYAYNSTRIEVPTYCTVSTGAYCPELLADANLICENDINVGAGSVTMGETENVAVYSINGNININTSTLRGKGLIYAPNGTVTIHVSNLNFEGSIIAKRINIQGSEIVLAKQKAGE
ncbi:MAG: hypothetical protein IJN16_08715 [Lachnospiraceae bacterium]|nr:hypothetical protein [Lachnospiraceae bacterium]